MITIGICDDELIHRKDIRELCEQYFEDNRQDCEFVEFASGEEILAYNKGKIHLLLLDVELGGVDGLEVLKYVEDADWVWRVVFVTNHEEVVWDSFGIKTLGFGRKPITYGQITRWIDITLQENKENVVFRFITTQGTIYKNVEDIFYMKAEGNYTYLYTRNGECLINDKLKIWEDRMRQTSMKRIHRSYLINLAHVRKWETNKVILESGESFFIGRQYAKKAKEEYYNYVRKHGTGRGITNDGSGCI